MVLIPAAARKVKIPLIASGGIGNGHRIAAALALGAEGVNLGTRFCATVEAPYSRQHQATARVRE
jgi:nitronate monooxygenase